MKIGVITFHRSENYGSALQAVAMSVVLKRLGYEPVFLDYICDADYKQYKLFRTYLYKDNIRSIVADIVYLKKNYERKKNFQKFIDNNLVLSNKLSDGTSEEQWNRISEMFDCFICGSDQIWNPRCFNEFNGHYFLDFTEPRKKIAYAPSFGNTEGLTEKEKKMLAEYLKGFYYLSVREKSASDFLKREFQREDVQTVLDPTMLLTKKEIETICKKVNIKKYIFVYIIGNITDYRKEMKIIYEFAKMRGLKIIYSAKKTTQDLKNAERLYSFGPDEFLGYIQFAEYVFSNSFHATVFSILMKKNFQTIARRGTNSRIADLLKLCELEDRFFAAGDIDNEIDYIRIEEKIAGAKKKSLEFLQTALNNMQDAIIGEDVLK